MGGFASIGLASVAAMAAEAGRQGDAWLSASERRRLAAITAPRRRAQFLAGRWALRRLLAAELGRAPPDYVLLAEENGPPRLMGGAPRLNLSLSHSGDTVACAVADGPVGIDVEESRGTRPIEGLLEAALSREERGRIAGLTEMETRARFLVAWTLKEAWLKHAPAPAGLGLTSLSRIQTAPAEGIQPHNAWSWTAAGCVLALVAPAATAVHYSAELRTGLEDLRPAAWQVAPAAELEPAEHGALG